MRSTSMTHCLQSSLRKRYAWKLKSSFTKEKAQDHVLCSKQIRNVDYKIDPPRQEARSSWETKSDAQSFRETGCNIVDYRVPNISISTVQQQDEQRQPTVAKLIEKFESHQYKEQSLKDIRRRRSTGSVKHRKNFWKMWTKQRSSNFAKILQNFNAVTAIPLRKLGLFIAVAGEIWSTIEVLQHFKRTTTIAIRSLATSSRRTPVEDQSMVSLRDELRSSRRKTC